jgi:hypothetical protein
MYLKAALIRDGHRIQKGDVWGHDLPSLLKELAIGKQFPQLVFDAAETFNWYFDEFRYPRELNKVEGIGESEGWLLEDAIQYLLPYAKGPKPTP